MNKQNLFNRKLSGYLPIQISDSRFLRLARNQSGNSSYTKLLQLIIILLFFFS